MITLTTHSCNGRELLTYYNFNAHELSVLRGALAVRLHLLRENLRWGTTFAETKCGATCMTDDDLEAELATVEELYNKMRGE